MRIFTGVRPVAKLGLWSWMCGAVLSAGCIITTGGSNDDTGGTDNSSDTETTNPLTTSDASGQMTSADSGDDTAGSTTDGPIGECSSNIIVDGGFEGGTPSATWTESSTNFNTPICDATCTEDPGAGPYAGDWYAWYGGSDGALEEAAVSQSVTIDGETAYLSFRFSINDSGGTGGDVFVAQIDDTVVFMVTDLDTGFEGYTPVSLDVSDFADGMEHTVTFSAAITGAGLTNFFLDQIELVGCTVGSESSGSGLDSSGGSSGDSGSGTTDGSSSSSDGGSSSGGSSGGSGSGSSSGTM